MMIKETIILVIAFLAICHAVPAEDSKPEVVAVAVPVESVEESDKAAEGDGDDLESSATYWRRPYYGGGWRGGWGGGWGGGYYGGYGRRSYGGWGHRGYGGWGRGYWR